MNKPSPPTQIFQSSNSKIGNTLRHVDLELERCNIIFFIAGNHKICFIFMELKMNIYISLEIMPLLKLIRAVLARNHLCTIHDHGLTLLKQPIHCSSLLPSFNIFKENHNLHLYLSQLSVLIKASWGNVQTPYMNPVSSLKVFYCSVTMVIADPWFHCILARCFYCKCA